MLDARRSSLRRFAGRYLAEALLLAAMAVNLAVAWWPRHFPYQDSTNHLARYVLIGNALFGRPAPFIHLRAIPTPYVGLDLVGALLTRGLGPEATLRIVVALALCALPVGMYCLLRATAPDRSGWAVVGALLGFNGFLLIGFFSYVIGVGLALCWLAAWWPHRDAATPTRAAALIATAAGLFFVHLAAALVVVAMVWLHAICPGEQPSAAGPGGSPALTGARWNRPACPAWLALGVTGAVLVPWVVWQYGARRAGMALPSIVIVHSVAAKLRDISFAFDGFSRAQTRVLVIGYLASLLAFLYATRTGRWRSDVLLRGAGMCFILYLIFPVGVGGAYFVDARWLLPALVLPFCCAVAPSATPTRALLAIPVIAVLVHGAVVHRKTAALDRRLEAFDDILGRVPPRSAVLPLVSDRQQWATHFSPYRHFALWHTIRTAGHVGGLLAADGQTDHDPPHDFFAHIRESPRLYYPSERWGTVEFFPLDWSRVAADYGYLIQAGDDERARTLILNGATEIARRGDVALYQVRTAPSMRVSAPPGSAPVGEHVVRLRVRPHD